MVDDLRELYAYNRWANERILDAASVLSEEELRRDLRSSFPSVLATLNHVAQADWIWLERWEGNSPTSLPAGWSVTDLSSLRQKWNEIQRRREGFVNGLTEARLNEELHYRTIRGDECRNPLWQTLRHVVNHATYHRGQVTTMLRQLGATPPSTDLIVFYRERAG